MGEIQEETQAAQDIVTRRRLQERFSQMGEMLGQDMHLEESTLKGVRKVLLKDL